MRNGALQVALLGFAVTLACTQPGPGPASVAGCDGPGLALARVYGTDARVAAGFALTAGRLADRQERPNPGGPQVIGSSWRARPSNELVSLCYYDGTFDRFAKGPAPAASGPTAPAGPYDRLEIVVDSSGAASLMSAGRAETMPIEDPTRP
jgi:hypothetical protein